MGEIGEGPEAGGQKEIPLEDLGYRVERTDSGNSVRITLPGNQEEGMNDHVLIGTTPSGMVTAFRVRGPKKGEQIVASGARHVLGNLLKSVFEAGKKSK